MTSVICVNVRCRKFNNSTALLVHKSLLWQHKSPVTNLRRNHINCVLLLTSAESRTDSLTKLSKKKCREAACQLHLYRQSKIT